MAFKIGSFNVKNLSYGNAGRDLDGIVKLIEKFDIVALQEVLSEGKILRGAANNMISGEAKAFENSLLYRLGDKKWDVRWCQPRDNAKSVADLGGDRRGEGYAFIWRKDRFELPKNIKGEIIESYSIDQYKLFDNNAQRLIRNPACAHFKVKNRSVEIRIINTHIIFGDTIEKRRNEFKILAGQIYNRVNENRMQTTNSVCTILLGDYNLNLESSNLTEAKIPEVAYFDKYGHYIDVRMQEDANFEIYTVQDKLTTLLSDSPGLKSNYDHFSFDAKVKNEFVKGYNRLDGMEMLYRFKTKEDKYKLYQEKISDHLPIMLYLDL